MFSLVRTDEFADLVLRPLSEPDQMRICRSALPSLRWANASTYLFDEGNNRVSLGRLTFRSERSSDEASRWVRRREEYDSNESLQRDNESGKLANERGTNAKRIKQEFNDQGDLCHSFAGIVIGRVEIPVGKVPDHRHHPLQTKETSPS